ncbi:hypothetical protein ZWY2020_008875 [Hordeum vulgare]|nr:hypothetical protein ZWY2020_008875 [Hordeum vulgare]
MAFASRMGTVLRRASGSSNSSLLQGVRCMSSSKLFVGGLSYATDDPTLRDAFSGYGEVIEARIIMDMESGRSKGFGFVTYESTEAAAAAISAMDGKDLHGRMIKVNYASDRAGGTRGGGYGTGHASAGGYGNAGHGGYSGAAGGVFGESTDSFSSGHSAVAGGNNGGNFAGNVSGIRNFAGSHNGSSHAGGFGGAETLGASKVQYNGQDDLLGADYFSESEDRHAGRMVQRAYAGQLAFFILDDPLRPWRKKHCVHSSSL